MSDDRWNTVLVLGGIRSGKSAFAEALVADAPSVRYVATAVGGENDPEWLARIEEHQRRRPQSWSTDETAADPARLIALLTEAKPDDTLLVDDLGGWVAAVLDPARQPNDDEADVAALAAAVRGCTARVVLVSPEVGLALVPTTPVGRAFTDALGATNQALAEVCDRVALVVAGQHVWLKATVTDKPDLSEKASVVPVVADEDLPEPELVVPLAAGPLGTVAEIVAQETAFTEPTQTLPVVGDRFAFEPGLDLPLPDGDAGPDARDRLVNVDFAGAGLGDLVEAVEFAAATQGTTIPRPWESVRVLLMSGRHEGGAAAGEDPDDAERRVAQVEQGEGVLSRLAGQAGADVAVLRVARAGAMEDGPVIDESAVDVALRQGWRLAEAAADAGRDLLVLASIGVGTDAVAAALSAAITGAEAVEVLPRVLRPGGRFDDEAWMVRCAAVRDALHRIRQEPRGAKDMLRELGGADLAVAVGALLGAASRRLPVVLDGPVGIAACLVARDLGSQARHWCLLPDAGKLALVTKGADVLGLNPVLDLGLGLGEGANALAALPLLRAAIGLAAAAPVHPALLTEPGDEGLADLIVPTEADLAPSVEADLIAPNDEADLAAPTVEADLIVPNDEADLAAPSVEADLIVPNDEDVDFAEPEPNGPGPATTEPEPDGTRPATTQE
ncbi:bifunctional adenosylcobinamide kinase/adenosylcobinamide-phosphate guanylyltransferase [Paractinoplanes globisporus]|uniref:Adenosylcobinamide kinase n=1 Tax=Paractinoplanes globisporus TaxID=113565 RepID=A0ABW6WH26_9ACTN|nr:bifunctional adenosylcobinamide kinase/adenosylcobinamide-phosphate guanylyltransferase [Actinoplanes globisporus]